MYWFFFFLLGLAVGSFLNSVIYRLDKKESIVKARSRCPHCQKVLSWFELIPLMSFIFQKGRCRHCGKSISLQYPLVELATGLLFVLVISNFWRFDLQWRSNLPDIIFWLFVVSCLVVIFVYDLKHYIIPNEIVYPGIVLGFGFWIWHLFGIWPAEVSMRPEDLALGILPTLFFLAIVLFSRGRWMGMGDVKLVLFMGLVLGWPNILVALFLAFTIGALVSIGLMVLARKNLKSQIPFGPFLAGATIIALFWGDFLIKWYLGLL